MARYNLHRWSVESVGKAYWAPEQMRIALAGFRDQDIKKVITSSIVHVNGREITTASGSIYILQDIDPDYLTWMEKEGIVYDPINPIKVKKYD
jgi:hypothetical protein